MFYYYGGKVRLASKYPEPNYDRIIEPFAGAAGYSMYWLSKKKNLKTTLIEKDSRVVELWHRLLAMSSQEILSISMPKAGEWTEDFLFMTVAASNALGRQKGYSFSQRAAEECTGMLRRIARLVDICRNRVTVIQGNYQIAPIEAATYFIDPPYQTPKKLNNKKTSNPKGQGYAKDCQATDLDFSKLSSWCQALPGQVIVCEMYGADWLPFIPLTKQTQNSQGVEYGEVVWLKNNIGLPL